MKNKTPASSRAGPSDKRRRQAITPQYKPADEDAFGFPTSPVSAPTKPATQPAQTQTQTQTQKANGPTQDEPRAYKHPLIVASFLPKGGVAKTTTALGLAGILASQGKRVLVADCDSQCSTTDFMVETFEDQKRAEVLLKLRKDKLKELVSDGADSEDETESEESDEEKVDNSDVAALPFLPGDKIRNTTKYYPSAQILARDHMLSSATAQLKTGFEAIEDFCQEGPTGCHLPHIFPYDPDSGNNLKNKIFLLAGDHRLADLVIPKDPDAQQQRAMFGLRWILQELCKEHSIDLVIVDMGPGISRVNKMLLHTADIVMPSFRPDYYAWGSYGHLVLDVLPEFLGSWLKEASRALRLVPQGGRKDWAAGLYPQQRDNRNAKLESPLFLPGLANQYYKPMSSATVNFIVSVQELINPSEDPSVLDESVQKVFLLAEAGQSVVAFMPIMPVFELSHELGIPATLLTQPKINKEMLRMEIKSRKDFGQDLDLIKKRFTALAKWISVLSMQICERPL